MTNLIQEAIEFVLETESANEGKNRYVAIRTKKRKSIEVNANTSYEAQQKAAKLLGASKTYEVSVYLQSLDGIPYTQLMEEIDYAQSGPWFVVKVKAQDSSINPKHSTNIIGNTFFVRKNGYVGANGEGHLSVWSPPYYAGSMLASEAKKRLSIVKKVPVDQQKDIEIRYQWELHR